MLELDHLTIIAPTLDEGVSHVQACLDIEVPFGQHHAYLGTYNHLLQLGKTVYLEIVSIDPRAASPQRRRWFGLDNWKKVRSDWDKGLRLRNWVARTDAMDAVLDGRMQIFGQKVSLPTINPIFDFAILEDGSLPLDGAAPSIIDRRGKPRSMDNIADLGARLRSFTLEHPEPVSIGTLYNSVGIVRPPAVIKGGSQRYSARIDTPSGLKILT